MLRRRGLLLTLLLVVAAGCAAVLVTQLARPAERTRRATPSERAALQRTIDVFESVHVPLASVRVATATPAWALAVEPDVETEDVLFERRAGTWRIRAISAAANPDGACAYAPAAVIRDLYGIACPPERALHARPATRAESAMFTAVFRTDPKTRRDGHYRGFHLYHVCISRLDANWAGAVAEFPDTGIGVWFRRTRSTWHVAHYESGNHERLRPRPIILSLASCVGYVADEFGA